MFIACTSYVLIYYVHAAYCTCTNNYILFGVFIIYYHSTRLHRMYIHYDYVLLLLQTQNLQGPWCKGCQKEDIEQTLKSDGQHTPREALIERLDPWISSVFYAPIKYLRGYYVYSCIYYLEIEQEKMNRVGGMKIEKAEHPHDVQIEQLLRNKVLHVSINFLRSYYVMYFYSILFCHMFAD